MLCFLSLFTLLNPKKKRYFMETNEFYNMSSDCVITFKQRMFFLGQHSRN